MKWLLSSVKGVKSLFFATFVDWIISNDWSVMSFTHFISFLKSPLFRRHLLIIASVVVGLVISFLIAIHLYTRHNQSVQVPDFRGVLEQSVAGIAARSNLRVEVVDSIYTTEVPKGAVVDQIPKAASRAKSGRIVFLTINARSDRMVSIPDVLNLSQRQAVAALDAAGIKVAYTQSVSSPYSNLVLGVNYKGSAVSLGQKMPVGSAVVLVVGSEQMLSEDSLAVDEEADFSEL